MLQAGGIETTCPSGTEPEYTGIYPARKAAPERFEYVERDREPSERVLQHRKILEMSQLLKSRGLLNPAIAARTVTPAAVYDAEAHITWQKASAELKAPIGKVPRDDDYKTAWEQDFKAKQRTHEAFLKQETSDKRINMVRYDIGDECVRLDTTPDQIFSSDAAAKNWLEENGVTTAKWMGYVTGHMGRK